ncbi:helix-turn-helix domain-containing protein [Alkaliphilus sp. MSJ-5]|uniref:Helix-turn-helix domain-containing protein n=1 Tax=Alkaliphilus flagellatus TaxID=2841507 RepID=A0ABS6G7Z5_9FIRM|nr:helix-turn-helix domain-containing protein [Alkaliphilus flagellatus]MBU5677743.1 helix-turn-helix domain-containing protein [Alkaliphilus flagellatus]
MNKIDLLRRRKSLSYGAIAKETGLTPTYICLLAKGKRTNPSLEVMQKISLALDEKVEKVFQVNQ